MTVDGPGECPAGLAQLFCGKCDVKPSHFSSRDDLCSWLGQFQIRGQSIQCDSHTSIQLVQNRQRFAGGGCHTHLTEIDRLVGGRDTGEFRGI